MLEPSNGLAIETALVTLEVTAGVVQVQVQMRVATNLQVDEPLDGWTVFGMVSKTRQATRWSCGTT